MNFCYSLVVDNKVGDEPLEAEVIEEDESTVNYTSFRKKRSKSSWSELGMDMIDWFSSPKFMYISDINFCFYFYFG